MLAMQRSTLISMIQSYEIYRSPLTRFKLRTGPMTVLALCPSLLNCNHGKEVVPIAVESITASAIIMREKVEKVGIVMSKKFKQQFDDLFAENITIDSL